LKHRVHEAREDVVDLGEQQGKEAMVAIAEDREQGHEVLEIVSGAKLEGIWVWWEE
jgi:hypothetical protein